MIFNTEGKVSPLNLSSKSNSGRRCTEIGCARTVCASKGLCRLTYVQSADQSRTWPVSKFGSSIYTPFEYSLDLIPVVCCHDRPWQQMRTHRFYYQFRERGKDSFIFLHQAMWISKGVHYDDIPVLRLWIPTPCAFFGLSAVVYTNCHCFFTPIVSFIWLLSQKWVWWCGRWMQMLDKRIKILKIARHLRNGMCAG